MTINPEKYGRYKKDKRPLHLKVRVILTRRMSEAMAYSKLLQAVETGVVPDGIEIRWVDWEKAEHGRASSGRIEDDVAEALRRFAGAIAQSEPRFEPVSPPRGHRRR